MSDHNIGAVRELDDERVRGGKVTRLVIWAERGDAFAELGLSE